LIKNLIFDLGNVLISFKPIKLLSNVSPNQNRIKRFILNIIKSDTWLKLDRGVLTFYAAKDIFIKKYPEDEDLINYFFKNWRGLFSPIPKTVSILEKLKINGYNTYALSNFPETPFEYVHSKYDFFKFFDGLVISYQEKLIKPEEEIYKTLLQKHNLIAGECLFIDDTEIFCLEAQKLGINTILFDLNLDLKSELKKFKIKI